MVAILISLTHQHQHSIGINQNLKEVVASPRLAKVKMNQDNKMNMQYSHKNI